MSLPADFSQPNAVSLTDMREALRRQNAYLRLLTQSAADLMAARDPQEMMVELFERIRAELPIDGYLNYALDEENDEIRLDAAGGFPEESMPIVQRVPLGQQVCGTVAKTCRAIELNQKQIAIDPRTFLLVACDFKAYACNPLMFGDRLIGTLAFASHSRIEFEADELAFFRAVAGYVAAAKVRLWNEAELERRIEARTFELRRANRELEAFAYSISHDFRAPLRAIVTNARMLVEDVGDAIEVEQREALLRQESAALRLASYCDELLGHARLGRCEVRRLEIDLSKLSRIVGQEIGIPDDKLVIEEDLCALGDPSLVRLALQNLIDNARKFSRGGTIWIGSTGGEEKRTFYVRDTGVGFDPSHASSLFQPFQRLHRDDEFPGTGIGLANVARIIERHGGTVWAESKLGEGTTFFFTLAGCPSQSVPFAA